MSDGNNHPNYMAIFWVLVVLTVLEVGAAQLYSYREQFEGIGLIALILLLSMAIVKALLVAAYFMHLRFENRTFVLVVSAPLIFAVILVLGLLPDVAFG